MVGVQGERKADICGEISSVPRQWVASREEPLKSLSHMCWSTIADRRCPLSEPITAVQLSRRQPSFVPLPGHSAINQRNA